ncbi:UDP-glucose dehydrogenase family protein [Acidithiobacillus caldus]|uniref:UDP-glucose dehydrogenase family protein n=1 Tax=Acidithiobacillus caldus TaxID=33059 RepID=UPI001C0729A4|nr:UDP-glucose/GDP-mannose dehydrogenase family protein [Acidithiobacillus caldus]MBU2762684.1 UDP-glucose/GDP-mannose dehydrogenase family protein [Acidithiobacillus caldus]MBU2771613.1 UDP-glucose/GDP-mannose dehydrogenase family protein [Acidithiobacillus caldus]
MKITVFGIGYVGLVSGACLAEVGNDILCMDVDSAKISLLEDGGIPIFEPGLKEMVGRNVSAGRLQFTTDVERAVNHGDVQFIAVGTPPDEDGSADLRHVLDVARNIGRLMNSSKIIVNKSTVPVGTAGKIREVISSELMNRGIDFKYSIVSNPEFLKEGAAVDDFMRPDRIIIGADDEQAIGVIRALYEPFQRNHNRIIVMDSKSAELTKYAANAMLATRISFMNELSFLAEAIGADIEMVRQGIGSDPRIGYSFLYSGCGYGGSCFPKDIKALIRTAKNEAGIDLSILNAVEDVNERQKHVLTNKIKLYFGDIRGKHFAVWGLAFKPDTDDMREAPSRVLIDDLISSGATVTVYDPEAMEEAKRVFGGNHGIRYAENQLDALDKADALIVVTEWKEFRSPDFEKVKCALKNPAIFDGRNIYEVNHMREMGFAYFAIGRL